MISYRKLHQKFAQDRSAFTLFEVLVALALSTLLIAAAYASFDLYWKLRTAGEEEVEQAQIARAILQRIELDLRATIYQPSAESDSSGSTASDEITAAEVIDPADASGSGNVGLMGDATNLVLSVSLPQSHATYAAISEGPIGLPTSDLKSVTYLLAGEGLGALQQAVAARFPPSAANGNSAISGLARIEGDRLLLTQADAVADVETIASQAQLLAAEIQSLQFEYTDGLDWYESWDTSFYGSLPRAVRITLSFQRQASAVTATEADPGKVYQLTVVLLPSNPSSSGTTSEYEETEN